ncbi:hypothetical protein [Spirosoma knui]
MRKYLRKISLFAVLTVWVSSNSWAQDWSFGPKVYMGLNAHRTQAEASINTVNVYSSSMGDASGGGLGVFARYDRPRWYGQIEASRGKYYLGGIYVSTPGRGSSLFIDRRRYDLRLIGGYKPLPWLRLHGGVVGVSNEALPTDYYERTTTALKEQIATEQNPSFKNQYEQELLFNQVSQAAIQSYKPYNLEGQLGVGVDIGGFTADLVFSQNLSPNINGIRFNGVTSPFRQDYSYATLNLGYRLFPIKRYLLAPRRSNRAYERLRRDIPFYRNEVQLAGGMLAEDIGSAFVYENRYTRYLNRRFGITTGVSMMRSFAETDQRLPGAETVLMGSASLRAVALYSRYHTISVSPGVNFIAFSGFRATSGRVNGSSGTTVNVSPRSYMQKSGAGWQVMLDYTFAITDRLPVGVWFRLADNSAYRSFGQAGLQFGYRF